MTRKEYREELVRCGYPEPWTKINFPVLLLHTASDLFIKEDYTSVLALETRRRLKQLNELGYTDD